MIELITADGPDVVCLQDVPAWALDSIGAWTGMQAAPVRATRPHFGPLAISAGFGRLLSSPNYGKRARRYTGRGNVILFPAVATTRAVKAITLNTNVFCEERGAQLGLNPKQMRAWERERRICHLVQYELPNRRRFMIATLHATFYLPDLRLADAELNRALSFVNRRAEVEEAVIVAGDFNVTREQSETIKHLESLPPESRWASSGYHVDHVMLRQTAATAARVWAKEERTRGGVVLSDHYPIEIELPY
jgi:endonuclease/exonuclease/phosphatase family metal-dependent hydrolase